MAKYIQFAFEDGLYNIPATAIATSRATYFAKKEVDESGNPGIYNFIFMDEYSTTLDDNYEIIDWLRNNMDWEDLETYAVKVADIPHKTHKPQWNKISSSGDGLEIVER